MSDTSNDFTATCDLETGLCTPAVTPGGPAREVRAPVEEEILYVGDPMCSWCWGLSPALERLQAHARERGIPFSVVVGGLRPGGGDPWTPAFKAFLRHHWEEIGERAGQPFSMKLLERQRFNYDTEPSCRAVVVARELLRERGAEDRLYPFFSAIQRKFFAESADPTEVSFYETISAEHGIDFATFRKRFESAEARAATAAEFALSRQLGVSAFPTVLLRRREAVRPIAVGFSTAEAMIGAIGSGRLS